MVRVIANPEDAARLNAAGEFEIEEAADPVSAALAQPSAVVVAKAGDGEALIATLRNRSGRQAEELAQGRRLVSYSAGGFLGLADEAVYTEEEPKKHWWQRKK